MAGGTVKLAAGGTYAGTYLRCTNLRIVYSLSCTKLSEVGAVQASIVPWYRATLAWVPCRWYRRLCRRYRRVPCVQVL